jgi:hypothetical protein
MHFSTKLKPQHVDPCAFQVEDEIALLFDNPPSPY